ncbi:MAG: M3 family oligoendopeptidase [Planctomycetota bacterium]
MPVISVPTDFIPANFDATDLDALRTAFQSLLDEPIESSDDLEAWLLKRSELDAALSEAAALLYIGMTCNTSDERASQAYARFIETVPPAVKPLAFELDRKQAALHERFGMTTDRHEVIARDTAADVALFREENVPIETELAKLSQEYDTIAGAMTVEFEGETKTLPQMAVYQESTDRAVRESSWHAVTERRLEDVDGIDTIYDSMIGKRHAIATNLGFDDYIGYAFKSKHRFDYTAADCAAFHNAVETIAVPFARKLDDRRRERLGLDTLMPWDMGVDELGRGPLKPFAGGAELVAKARAAFAALDPRLESLFAEMGDGTDRVTADNTANPPSLDLDSRKGKAPGGYLYMLDRRRSPFIFMNAAGLHRDVETMVHEAGHAFHSMLCAQEPLLHYREYPTEFAEVASMAMELMTMPHWGAPGSFYDGSPDDLARAQRKQLEGSIALLPWIATIDAFQHWIYANPTHTRGERTAAWLDLDNRFGRAFSWDGLDEARAKAWQRQGHLFGAPFYYIEYGIAQLGALQLWIRSLDEGPATSIDAYINALTLGGSRPLPELFNAAGLTFDFGPETVGRLVERVEKELAKLPE